VVVITTFVHLAGELRESLPVMASLKGLGQRASRRRKVTTSAPRPQAQRRLTDETVDDLVRAYQDGATLKDLVERFGICQTTVIAHLDRRGVPRRQLVGLSPDEVTEATRASRERAVSGRDRRDAGVQQADRAEVPGGRRRPHPAAVRSVGVSSGQHHVGRSRFGGHGRTDSLTRRVVASAEPQPTGRRTSPFGLRSPRFR
jgi:hypothetical protein